MEMEILFGKSPVLRESIFGMRPEGLDVVDVAATF